MNNLIQEIYEHQIKYPAHVNRTASEPIANLKKQDSVVDLQGDLDQFNLSRNGQKA
jgi:hypothetical protein